MKLYIIVLGLLAVLAVLVWLVVRARSGKTVMGLSFDGEEPVTNRIELPPEELVGQTELSLFYTAEQIELVEAPGDSVILEECLPNFQPEMGAQVSTKGSRLVIEGGQRQADPALLRSKIILHLPKSWKGGISLATVGGDITVQGDWVLEQIRLTTTSGLLRVGSLSANRLTLWSSSGAITAETLTADAIDCKTQSGGVTVSGSICGALAVSTVSGALELSALTGEGRIITTSGMVTLDVEGLTGDLSCQSDSGRMAVRVPENLAFHLAVRSTSGPLWIDLEEASTEEDVREYQSSFGATAEHTLSLATVSSSIRMKTR